MLSRVIALLTLSILLLAGQAVYAAGPSGNGTIQGTVVNKTSGSTSSVASQPVTLNIYQSTSKVNSQATRTDVEGKYSFGGLSTDAGYTYEVDILYQGADYYSDPLQFAAGENAKSADILVNDPTSTDESISIMLAHVVLTKDSSGLNVSQYYYFANSGDRAYIGKPSAAASGKNETLKLVLPAGASNFQIAYGLTDSNLIKNGNVLTDTVAVTPAGREISFSYKLPLASEKLDWTFNYDVSRFDILTSDPTIKLAGDKITAQQPLSINGNNYQDYSSEGLTRGNTVSASLNAASATSGSNSKWAFYLIVPIALAVAAIGIVVTRRKKNVPQSVNLVSAENPDLKEKLLNEIAALDDSFEAGNIEEKEYQRLRSEKKRKLVTLSEIMDEVRKNKD
jgi:hypothetical protein